MKRHSSTLCNLATIAIFLFSHILTSTTSDLNSRHILPAESLWLFRISKPSQQYFRVGCRRNASIAALNPPLLYIWWQQFGGQASCANFTPKTRTISSLRTTTHRSANAFRISSNPSLVALHPVRKLTEGLNSDYSVTCAPERRLRSTEAVPMLKPEIDNVRRLFASKQLSPSGNLRTSFVGKCDIPTSQGQIHVRSYQQETDEGPIDVLAICKGILISKKDVYLRVHDQCLTSEVFGSQRCDCKEQLDRSLQMVHQGNGLLIYQLQEGRGIGLANKIAAYGLQDIGMDTVDANRHLGFHDDRRSYESVPFILENLKINSVRLVTNNPRKIAKLRSLGIKIEEVVPLIIEPNEHNKRYLLTKQERMSHFLCLQGNITPGTNCAARNGTAIRTEEQQEATSIQDALAHPSQQGPPIVAVDTAMKTVKTERTRTKPFTQDYG